MNSNQDNSNGLWFLIILGIVFPPLGGILLTIGIVVLLFAFFDWALGSLLEAFSNRRTFTEDYVPELWSKRANL